jgi:hypothetical protein
MPDRALFTGTTSLSPTEAYYAVLLHELTHWSGAPHRLDRQFGTRFGDEAYAYEELVASSARPSCAPRSASPTSHGPITPRMSRPGSKSFATIPGRYSVRRLWRSERWNI